MPEKKEYLVFIKDFPGTAHKRLEVRQAHFAALGDNKAFKIGGRSIKFISMKLTM
jgi:uncharacterized protein YciI